MTNLALIQEGGLPAHLRPSDGVARGNENITHEDLKTPRLYLLQSNSAFTQKGSSEFVKGAEASKYLVSVINTVHDELYVANLKYRMEYAAFKKRGLEKDFRGIHESKEAAIEHIMEEGLNPDDYDIKPQATHTLALINPETGEIDSVAEFSMSSTSLGTSSEWNTAIIARNDNADRFASVWRMGSAFKSNDKGSWYTPTIEFAGFVDENLYQKLNKLYSQLTGE